MQLESSLPPEYYKGNEKIKQATQFKREKNLDAAISKIDEALAIFYDRSWHIKLIDYLYKNGNFTGAEAELEKAKNIAELEKDFYSQFTWDAFYFDRLRIWEKNKELKSNLEYLVRSKQTASNALNNAYISDAIFLDDDYSFDFIENFKNELLVIYHSKTKKDEKSMEAIKKISEHLEIFAAKL